MITFIHTADIHFGVENYGKIDPQTGIHTRLLDFEKALNFCIDVALEKNVDFFLFCGDAYKTAHPSPTQQRLLFNCLLRLFNAKIPVVIIVGNHDNPLSFGKAHSLELFGQLPVEGFHVIAKPTKLVLQTKNGAVQLVGIPWPARTTIALKDKHATHDAATITTYLSDAVREIIKQLAADLDPNIPAVLAGHLTVSSGIFSGSEKRAIYGTDPIFFPSDLAIAPFDYVALGHLHRYQNLNPQGYPAIIYSGSIERVDFGERKEEKGFCVVRLINKQTTEHEFIKTPTRTFIQIEVTLEECAESHTTQIITAIKKQAIANTVIKILYHVPPTIKDRIDVIAIQQACAGALYLVGVFPVRALPTRERRAVVKVDMTLQQLLKNYFATKPELESKQNELLIKALELEAELNEGEST